MRPSTARNVLLSSAKICKRCNSTFEPVAGPRLRFAPSPTGHLHLGGLRTALFNHLVARKGKGKWILRVEDTDRARYVPGAVDSLRRSLEWAGLEYDEGIGAGGNHGPYIQSERRDLYHQRVKMLLENDKAYECFCSPTELEAIRVGFTKMGSRISYDGRCRHLTEEDRTRRKKAGHGYVVRFKDPGDIPTMPRDLVFGEVNPHTDTGHANRDDFILMKADGYPTYHLASVVDDHDMRISHVLRGEEWLPSLPKHVSLYQAFGWRPPAFAHLPLLTNEKGHKLSKRKDDVTIESYRDRGYEPEALLNFVALLGWDPNPSLTQNHGQSLPTHERDDQNSLYEVFSMAELIQAFSLDNVSRRKAQVNMDKLKFLNKMTMRLWAGTITRNDAARTKLGKSTEKRVTEGKRIEKRFELLRRYQADLKGITALRDSSLVDDKSHVERVFDLEVPRITVLKDMAQLSIYFYKAPNYETFEAQEMFRSSVKDNSYVDNLEALSAKIEEISHLQVMDTLVGWEAANKVVEERGLRARSEVLMQARHALTGQQYGPRVPEIMDILGYDETLTRLRAAIEHVRDAQANQLKSSSDETPLLTGKSSE